MEIRSRFKTEELKPVTQEYIKPILPHFTKTENKEIIENDLFTIPEIEASSPQEMLQSKRQLSNKEGCVQVPSDYSHDRESDHEQSSEEENGKLDKNGTGSKPKRSNSIPSGMRRTSSCEEEKKEVRIFQGKSEC